MKNQNVNKSLKNAKDLEKMPEMPDNETVETMEIVETESGQNAENILENAKGETVETIEKVETELEKIERFIMEDAEAIKCSKEQYKIALLVLAKLKNYFSDTVRTYKLASNHKEAFKAILDYVVDKKFEKIEDLANTLYCVRKESPKKAVSDEIIKKIATIEISPRKSSTKLVKRIF